MSEIKPLLRQMIDNNKPYWRPATIQGAHKQLDEYEAKAKAFDRIVEERNQAGTSMYGKDDDVFYRVIESAFWNIDGIIVEYESGEPKVYKCTCGARYWSMVNYKEHLTNCFDG